MIRPMGSVIKSLSKEERKTVYSLCRNGFRTSKTHSHSMVASAVEGIGIALSYQWIIGDDLKQPHQIVLEFYEGEAKEYDKKGLLKQSAAIDIIMPDRPFIAKTAFDFFKKMEKEAIENAARKEQEQASHTPHMVSARQLFTAVAKAILLDHRRKRDGEIEALAEQLRLHAEMKSDWPLEITFAKRFPICTVSIIATVQ